MKPRQLLAFVVALGFAPVVGAAPVPVENKNTAGPVLAVQTKSFDHLLDLAKTTAKKFFPDAMYKEFEKDALGKLDPSNLKGIDTKKPFGLYATLSEGLLQGNFAKSSVVALVPVSDEKDFVELLGKMELKVEKKEDVYTILIPNAPVSASMRFLKGYAYISVSTDALDPKMLLDPRDIVNDKETAAVVLRVRADRIPNDLKQGVLALLAQGVEQGIKEEAVPPEGKEFVELFTQTFLRWVKTGLEDSKEIVVRLDLDPNTGAFVVEKTIEAKSGTAFAKSIAALKPTKNDFAGIIGADSAGHVLLQTPLFVEDIQVLLGKLVVVFEKGVNDAGKGPKEVQDALKELVATIDRTVKSGNLDMAASLRGPDKNGFFTAVGAFSLKETTEMEKAFKAALKLAPNKLEKIKIDAFKVGDINVHELLMDDNPPAAAKKIFGKISVFVALAPNGAFVTYGARAKEVMQEVLAAKLSPKPAPLVQAEVNGKRLATLLKIAAPENGNDGLANEFIEKLAQVDRVSLFKVDLKGGDRLVVRLELGLMPLLGSSRTTTVRVDPVPPPMKLKPK